MNDYAKDISIQKDSLDSEWLTHPDKVYQYAKLHADATDERNRTKEKLNVVDSELWLKARSNPKDNLPDVPENKISEAVIKAWIITQPNYKEALEEYLKACHKVDILKSAVNALDARKAALGNLVSLWLAKYFSTPKVEESYREEVEQSVEEDFRKVQLEGLKDMEPQLKTLKRKKKNEGSD